MNASRIWTLGAGVVVVAICGGAVALGVQPALAAASASDASTAQVEAASANTQTELGRLAGLAAKQSALDEKNARVGRAVTGSLRLNTFSRQLREVAATDGVRIIALSTSEAVDYVPPTADAGVAGAAPAATPAPTPTASPGATPAVTTPATPASTGVFAKTDPLITGSNFAVIPVTVVVAGDEGASIAFAQDVQQMTRLFAVDTITYSKGSGDDVPPSTTVSGNIYALRP
jgi:hypothetical protein